LNAAVEVRDLWLTFPGRSGNQEIHVLQHINMDVSPGELVCIVGPSGCGKTTLLNAIGGFLEPT
jgi:NitT/TauT family transport system ATP-binding protein